MSADETTLHDAQSDAVEQNAGQAEPTADSLQAQLETLQKQAQEYLDGWQRARAEFANYKKRVERETQENREMATGMAFKSMLPVIDDFDRAMSNIPDDLKDHAWIGGLNMVIRKLNKTLEDNGVVSFDPVGEMFDPNRHEAIGTEDAADDVPSGQVTATMQRGYLVGDRVLRPALVRVAK